MENVEEDNVIDNGTEWLEFKYTTYIPAKYWWQQEKSIECYANIRRDHIGMVRQCVTESDKTIIHLKSGQKIVVNMPYEKVMELV